MNYLLAAGVLVYPILIVAVVYRLGRLGIFVRSSSTPGWLTAFTLLLGVIAIINSVTPWIRRRQWQMDGNQAAAPRDKRRRALVMGLPFVAAPASYALLLHILGTAFPVTCIFAALSFLAAAAWDWQVLISDMG